MVAFRPNAVEGQEGQKFVVTKRFSGDGYDFVPGDVIVAKQAWVHKIPRLIDQKLISPYMTPEVEAQVPVNLVDKTDEVVVSEDSQEVVEGESTDETQKEDNSTDGDKEGKEKNEDIEQSEIDKLAKSLLD